MTCYNSQPDKGFAMVELSIALIFIGLLVAGGLVGRDLIRGAEIRATLSQLERFNATVNTFRTKYSQIPGDTNKAESLGLANMATGQGHNGDANGLISSYDGSNSADSTHNPINQAKGEIVNFWYHLAQAKLIEGSYDAGVNTKRKPKVSSTFPRSKVNRGGFTVYHKDGVNHFHIGVTNSKSGTAHSFRNNLRPEDAYTMDVKIDDGFPETGKTLALSGNLADWENCMPGEGSSSPCASISSKPGANDGCMLDQGNQKPREYDLFSTDLLCQLRIKMD